MKLLKIYSWKKKKTKKVKLLEQIIKEKKSPEVVAKELHKYGFNIEITGRTIRNGIKSGLVFNKIKQGKIIYTKEYKEKIMSSRENYLGYIEKIKKRMDAGETSEEILYFLL